jgi:hypothetical protein
MVLDQNFAMLRPREHSAQHVVHYRPGFIVDMHDRFTLRAFSGSDERVDCRCRGAIRVGQGLSRKQPDLRASETLFEEFCEASER